MIREIIQKEKVKYYCDYCQKEMEFPVAECEFGYGSDFDTEHFQFCSDKCLALWCKSKIKINK